MKKSNYHHGLEDVQDCALDCARDGSCFTPRIALLFPRHMVTYSSDQTGVLVRKNTKTSFKLVLHVIDLHYVSAVSAYHHTVRRALEIVRAAYYNLRTFTCLPS